MISSGPVDEWFEAPCQAIFNWVSVKGTANFVSPKKNFQIKAEMRLTRKLVLMYCFQLAGSGALEQPQTQNSLDRVTGLESSATVVQVFLNSELLAIYVTVVCDDPKRHTS